MRNPISAAIPRALPALIEQTAALERDAARLFVRVKINRVRIKEALLKRKLTRQPTDNGYEALLIAEERFAWNTKKLRRLLGRAQFEKLCPRRPEGTKLRALLESSARPDLRRCAKVTRAARLELRAPLLLPVGESPAARRR